LDEDELDILLLELDPVYAGSPPSYSTTTSNDEEVEPSGIFGTATIWMYFDTNPFLMGTWISDPTPQKNSSISTASSIWSRIFIPKRPVSHISPEFGTVTSVSEEANLSFIETELERTPDTARSNTISFPGYPDWQVPKSRLGTIPSQDFVNTSYFLITTSTTTPRTRNYSQG
jgi:hypothetical protein